MTDYGCMAGIGGKCTADKTEDDFGLYCNPRCRHLLAWDKARADEKKLRDARQHGQGKPDSGAPRPEPPPAQSVSVEPSAEDRDRACYAICLGAARACVKDGKHYLTTPCGERDRVANAIAEARQEGDRAGWDRRGERIAAWFETKAEMLSTGTETATPECAEIIKQHRSDAKFIRTTGYEPPVEPPKAEGGTP